MTITINLFHVVLLEGGAGDVQDEGPEGGLSITRANLSLSLYIYIYRGREKDITTLYT